MTYAALFQGLRPSPVWKETTFATLAGGPLEFEGYLLMLCDRPYASSEKGQHPHHALAYGIVFGIAHQSFELGLTLKSEAGVSSWTIVLGTTLRQMLSKKFRDIQKSTAS